MLKNELIQTRNKLKKLEKERKNLIMDLQSTMDKLMLVKEEKKKFRNKLKKSREVQRSLEMRGDQVEIEKKKLKNEIKVQKDKKEKYKKQVELVRKENKLLQIQLSQKSGGEKQNLLQKIKELESKIKLREKYEKILEIPESDLVEKVDENGKVVIIGEGGSGIVKEYIYKDQMAVAVKEIPSIGLKSKIIEKEVKIAKFCYYPHVIQVFGYTKLSKKKIGIVMEKVDGCSLLELILEKEVRMTNFEKWFLIKIMTKTINYLHSKKVIHRDIDPSNWLVSSNKRDIKIIDFGMSTIKLHTAAVSKTTTKLGGKARFMAPEIIGKNKEKFYGVKSDLFALGMSIYFVVAERLPFYNTPDDISVVYAIKDGDKPDFPKEKEICEEFKKIIEFCLEFDSKKRATTKDILEFMQNAEQKFVKENPIYSEKEMKNTAINIEKSFICPITLELMQNPVTLCSGNTYEFIAIYNWIKNFNTDPLTGELLANKLMFPNISLKSAIEEWKKEKSKKITIDGIKIFFPYEHVYPEQYQYMYDLLQGHVLLEMPCGTGKTMALLSLIVSYQLSSPTAGKLIYCTRTVTEMVQVFSELKKLHNYLYSQFKKSPILSVGLSSRKNLCVHQKINGKNLGSQQVDSICRSMTAKWVIEKLEEEQDEDETEIGDIEDLSVEVCSLYLNYLNNTTSHSRGGKTKKNDEQEKSIKLENGVYSLEELKDICAQKKICPYFVAREAINQANVVIFNYQYLLDPKISSMISKGFNRNAIVVFDEAHNIDNICIQSLSVNINKFTLKKSESNIKKLKLMVERKSESIQTRLKNEYTRLVSGVGSDGVGYSDEFVSGNPVLPEDILQQAVPGTIRKGINFLNFLRRLIIFINKQLSVKSVETTFPESFLIKMKKQMFIDQKTLRFCSSRLLSLMNTLKITNFFEFLPLNVICDFASLVGTYQKGFCIIIEPFDSRTPTIRDPVLQFCCLDSRIAIKNVFDKFKNVVITSGTLSPKKIYPQLLGFTPVLSKSYNITLVRNCICPVILSKGNDQVFLTTEFKKRSNRSIIRNYGRILCELCQTVPDGIVCFFTSYGYLEEIYTVWHNMGIISDVLKNKLLFVESGNTQLTSIALINFKKACDSGRGAVFLCVARGKVSEGVDFDGHYGRAVILFGVPFLNTKSCVLNARMNFISKNLNISNDLFLNFDAIRNSSQCMSRVLRNKTDYGIMILADKRFNRKNRKKMFPEWIRNFLTDDHCNLSADAAIGVIRKFLLEMSQNWEEKRVLGKLLLDEKDIEREEIEKSKKKKNEKENRKRKVDEHYLENKVTKKMKKK